MCEKGENMNENLVRLSRTMSYALRHHPEELGLKLDDEGWVAVEDLLKALRQRQVWQNVREEDFVAIIEQSDKRRYEMRDGMIRAYYGHTVSQKIALEPATPPAILFHGTTRKAAKAIKTEGLKPMKRQYVHLATEEETAQQVGLRRTPNPVILKISALQASQHGIKFYLGNDMVWLADPIPPQFIQFPW